MISHCVNGPVSSETSKPSVIILVYAWDTYEPAWPVFCYGLHKYWADCPYPLVFITNYLEPPCGIAIKVGDINNFYQKMSFALECVMTPYILFMHEDYWIKRSVNTQYIEDYVGLLEQDLADYIRLIPVPPPDRDFSYDSRLGVIDLTSEYRVSFMASLWRVSTLQNIMQPTLSLWEHEKYGVKLSASYGDRFLSVKKPSYGIDYLVTAISGRRWAKAAYRYATDEQISVDFSKLVAPPRYKVLVSDMHSFVYRVKRRILKKMRKNKSSRRAGWGL